MAITVRDQHGTYTRRRRAEGPKLDRKTARYFAVVENVWSRGFEARGEGIHAPAQGRQIRGQRRRRPGAIPGCWRTRNRSSSAGCFRERPARTPRL